MSTPKKQSVQRKWMPYTTAARQYLGVSEDILLGAIKRGELPAFEKPITRGRTGTTRQNHSWFVNLSDVDDYIRANWGPYSC